jgi:hypothetical protein
LVVKGETQDQKRIEGGTRRRRRKNVLPTVKILTFSSGESIKDELRHSQRAQIFKKIGFLAN